MSKESRHQNYLSEKEYYMNKFSYDEAYRAIFVLRRLLVGCCVLLIASIALNIWFWPY